MGQTQARLPVSQPVRYFSSPTLVTSRSPFAKISNPSFRLRRAYVPVEALPDFQFGKAKEPKKGGKSPAPKRNAKAPEPPPPSTNPILAFLDSITNPRLFVSRDIKNIADSPDKNSETSADGISLPGVALLGLFMGSGVTFAMFRSRRGPLTAGQVPLC